MTTVPVDFTMLKPNIREDAIRISNSSIKTWRKCKREYYYKFVLKLEKKLAPKALYKGKVIHEIIEEAISGRDWKEKLDEVLKEYDGLFEEQKEEYGDLPNELPQIVNGYFKYYENDGLQYMDINGKKAEHSLYVPLDGKPIEESLLVYTGKIDAIPVDEDGRVWLMDHKTFTSLPDENFRFTNQQVLLYAWAMREMGWPVPDGVLWDYIRTKVPSQPQLLKDGSLSKRAIDTTPQVYLDAILEHGLDPDDYQDMLEKLQGREDDFYRRIFLPINWRMVEPVVEDLKETAAEIKHLHDLAKARSLDRHCSYCSFKMVCQADLQGDDADFILRNYYKESTYHVNTKG